MEKKYKNDFKKLIVNSKLNQNQKLLWDLFLRIADPEETEAVFEAASESEENIILLTKYLKDKIKYMKENNEKAWLELTENQEKYAKIL